MRVMFMDQADNPNSTNPSGVALTRKGERYAAAQRTDEIERLLTFLDNLDGDPDFEPEQELEILPDGTILEHEDGDDESSLGATNDLSQARAWARRVNRPGSTMPTSSRTGSRTGRATAPRTAMATGLEP
jgi:hypothetical protein